MHARCRKPENAGESDSETSVHYYRARYYDTLIGRFSTEDPEGLRDNTNMFAYVHNRPTNSTDPFGLYQLKGFPAVAELLMNFGIQGERSLLAVLKPRDFKGLRALFVG